MKTILKYCKQTGRSGNRNARKATVKQDDGEFLLRRRNQREFNCKGSILRRKRGNERGGGRIHESEKRRMKEGEKEYTKEKK
jgi:hypothetical protein